MEKITAIIPSFNEEQNIAGAIESCLFADEVIVVDSFSTDKTAEIVKSYPTVKFLVHEYKHSAAQKNWTIPQASNDWIFLLDSDERTNEKLISEINYLNIVFFKYIPILIPFSTRINYYYSIFIF